MASVCLQLFLNYLPHHYLSIFPFVTRQQILSALPEKYKQHPHINRNLKILFTVVFSILNIVFIFADSSPSAVMGFTGAVTCYFIAYFFPLLIKIKIHNKSKKKLSNPSLLTENFGEEDNEEEVRVGKFHGYKLLFYWGILVFGSILMLGEIFVLIKCLV